MVKKMLSFIKVLKFRNILIYLFAIVIGYSSMLFLLGNEGRGLVSNNLPKDIILRRNFLINALSKGPTPSDFFRAGEEQYAGEWTIGTYAMSSYALTNIAMKNPQTAKESSEFIAKWIEYCTNSKITNFDELAWNEKPLNDKTLNKDYGHIGYYGHINLMLGCYALLNNDGRFKELHQKLSEAIARRMLKYPHRHIETYPGETYPPDNTVAAASLRVADMTLGTNYKTLVDEWVEQSKRIEYTPYGLVSFQIDIDTGKPLQSCRGSNIGWNSFFMPLVDENYAKEQFDKFKKYMLWNFIGVSAFREHPDGSWFKMDRDTGPVIFGLGGTATGFAVAGAVRSGDSYLASRLLRPFELLGVSVTKNNEKRYLAIPVVGDAIMLAMKTACIWRPLWK